MSLYGIDIIMTRIKHATPGSAIAVFECGKRECLNSVFADTVESRKNIKRKNDGFGYRLIGVYHRYSDLEVVREKLVEYLR